MKTYRFSVFGYVELPAETEAEARSALVQGVQAMVDGETFVCVSPSELSDVFDEAHQRIGHNHWGQWQGQR